ncbi:MAG: tetratricopeptide repeat protein [Candidatus Atribacteria bacterium]|nr:tetratricopeptide repeat protein [Candidatus Atribacteria bacterium]
MKDNVIRKNRIFSLMIYIAFSLFFIFIAQILPSYSSMIIALADSGPSIYFPEYSWDFGEITPDELPTHIFKFENIGDEVLIIKETKVSCESCIDPIISTRELNPGEAGELKITVNSLDMIGRFTKRIYLESNDPVNPQVVITVSGFIKEKDKLAAQIQPKPQPQTPFSVGISYFGQGEYDKAITEFEKSIELDENHTESYYYLGQCYLQKGIIEYNNKNILKAYSLYRKANKFAEQAIPQYEKIIENNPKDLNSYLKLGYIYETRSIVPFIDEYNEALEYYLKALDLAASPSSAGNTGIIIYLNTRIGVVCFNKNKYSQAIEYLEIAEKVSPQNIEVAYYLGLSYDKIGEIEKAREFLSRVIELAPQSEFAREAEKELKKINKD